MNSVLKVFILSLVLIGTSLAGDTPEAVTRLRENINSVTGYTVITGVARNAIWIQREPERDDMICFPVPLPPSNPKPDDE